MIDMRIQYRKFIPCFLLALLLFFVYRHVTPAQNLFSQGNVPSGVTEVYLESEEWSNVGEQSNTTIQISVEPSKFFQIMGEVKYRRALFPPEKWFSQDDFPLIRFTIYSDKGESTGLLCATRPYLYWNNKCYYLPNGTPYQPLLELISA